MRPMVQGTEHEYTLYCKRMQTLGVDPHILGLEMVRQSDLHGAGEFLKNGSRAYYDVGHFEISTAECSNPRDVVIWEKAGEKVLDWVRKVIEEKYLAEGVKVWAFKNNTSPDGTSYGSHENYCVLRKVLFPDAFLKELVPHFITRFIYTGSGDIIDNKFVLSPMIYLTSTVISGETMHSTGILNTRDEPHALAHRWRRLHVIVGDALMNETAIYLRHFTTTAILQLMEDGALNDVPEVARPVEDMWHNVEKTNPTEWKVHLKDGKVVSPMEIQRYYLAKVEPLVQSQEEKRVFKIWEDVLDGLEKKRAKELARRIEWLDRYYAIQEQADSSRSQQVEMMACKQYSEVGADRSLYYKRQASGLVERQVTDEEIMKAIHEPPPDTRARLRSRLCEKYDVTAVDWSFVVVDNGERKRINMVDPYSTELSEDG